MRRRGLIDVFPRFSQDLNRFDIQSRVNKKSLRVPAPSSSISSSSFRWLPGCSKKPSLDFMFFMLFYVFKCEHMSVVKPERNDYLILLCIICREFALHCNETSWTRVWIWNEIKIKKEKHEMFAIKCYYTAAHLVHTAVQPSQARPSSAASMQSNNIYEIYLLYFMYLNLFLAIWNHLLKLEVHVCSHRFPDGMQRWRRVYERIIEAIPIFPESLLYLLSTDSSWFFSFPDAVTPFVCSEGFVGNFQENLIDS